MIKKVGSLWFVFNHSGIKKLSRGYKTKTESEKRLREIEFFSHRL